MSVLPVGFGSAAGGTPAGAVERSLRFNSADSAYLNRTPASAGNRKTWTWSCWFKGTTAAFSTLLSGFDGSAGAFYIRFAGNGGGINVGQYNTGGSTGFDCYTLAVTRDPSAWYHIVVALDTTQATDTNRVKIYINSTLQTLTGTYPPQNQDCWINSTTAQAIGRFEAGIGQHANGYMTEINFIDGQALTPSSFGETDSNTGVWKPKAFSGTYGTNGFYLKFADNSGTTSTTLGKDSSGNGNNWTPNNFSVTAGAGNDSLVDSPTAYGTDTGVGGTVRGNYATLNPLSRWAGGGSVVLSEGNLKAAFTNQYANHGTIAVSSGKYYWEAVVTSAGINSTGGGIMTVGQAGSNTSPYLGWVLDVQAGRNYYNNSYTTLTGGSFASGDRLGVAVDMDNGKIWYAKNGTWLGTSADPAAGTGAAQTNVSGEVVPVFYEGNSGFSATWEANFGQRAFAYTAPSGFKALCTQNLPTPTIGATSTTQADDYFDAVLWSGDSSLSRNITGWDFNLDFLWVKQRNTARDHWLVDRVRGVQKGVVSNSTAAESTDATATNAFVDGSGANASGFTAGNGSAVWAGVNGSGNTYVGWGWKANGAGSTNTAGTITSTVSANTTSGFSIVTYTGNATSGATIGHGLGVAPSMVIVKNRSTATNWPTWHTSIANTELLKLNLTDAKATDTAAWNSTTPTSTVVTLGNSTGTNGSGNSLVAYCFAPVAGYSAFGSYTGNGSTDGPMIFTGFRPRYVLIKPTASTGGSADWLLIDSARYTYNVSSAISPAVNLVANSSAAEDTNLWIQLMSNGFKCASTQLNANANGVNYIYAAFAETPAKFSLAR